MKLSLSVILLFYSLASFAQNGNNTNIWYFGEYAGLDFNSGAPVVLNNSAMNTIEGCASICDGDGELLFYTDGINVWNQEHQVMENGAGLLGNSSSSQSSIIVPAPGFEDLYYIFTTMVADAGMRYSIVDMSLDAGLGAIVVGEKNVLFHANVTEKLVATLHSNLQDFWIIGHEWGNNNYVAYQLTPVGLNNVPIVSSVGSTLSVGGYQYQHSVGCLQVSYQGDKLAAANFFNSGNFELFDFDNSTGQLTMTASSSSNFYRPYGVEFSPNGNFLYGTVDNQEYTDGRVYQFDLSEPNPLDNPVLVGSSAQHMPGIQLAPDNKIYVTVKSTSNLAVINQPNEPGVACDFVHDGIDLQDGVAWRGFPQLQVYEYFDFEDVEIFQEEQIYLCQGDSIQLIPNDQSAETFDWSTGETTPTIFVSEEGTYTLEISSDEQTLIDSIFVELVVPDLDLGPDITMCPEETATIEATGEYDSIEWLDGSESNSYQASSAGSYWAEALLQNCPVLDTVVVSQIILPEVDLESEYYLCSNDDGVNISIDVEDNLDISWSNNETSETTTYFSSGSHWLEITMEDCSFQEDFEILPVPQNLIYSQDTILCEGTSIELELLDSSWSGSWSIGEMGNSVTTNEPGVYQVESQFGECLVEDQIEVEMVYDPDIEIDDQLICPQETISLNITQDVDELWLNDMEIENNWPLQSEGFYELEYTVEMCTFSSNFEIEYFKDTLSLKNNYELCDEDSLELAIDPQVNPQWSDGTRDSVFIITEPGNFQLDFEMLGCEFTREIFVEETIECPCDEPVFVPNAFTPDNDGLNDVFQPVIHCPLSGYHLQIFNRWGQIVFDSSDKDKPWDGSHQQGGYFVENGVYQYVLQIRRIISVDDEVYTGHITIFR